MLSWAGIMAVLCCLAVPAVAAFPPPYRYSPNRWMLTERLRNDYNGQPHYNYSDSFSSLGSYVAVGARTANLGKGEVTILYDGGMGLQTQATLRDASGVIGDWYGSEVKLFTARGLLHIVVSAELKSTYGAVFLYRQKYNRKDLWELQGTYYPPTGVYVNNFGRTLHFDGTLFLVSAERRYQSGPRFEVSAVNLKGTSYYTQADGVSGLAAGDPVFVYALSEERNNGTSFALSQTIQNAPFTEDFGTAMDSSNNVLVIGGSNRELLQYGHGTDGDLEVTGVYLLDGTAEYNFNSVYIRSGGTLTVGRYDEQTQSGGTLKMRVKNQLYIEAGGAINVSEFGYLGGSTSFTGGQNPEVGGGPGGGKPATSTFTGVMSCNFDGSASVATLGTLDIISYPFNSTLPFAEACGGGGSYGTNGTDGTPVYCGTSGVSGSTYGDALLSTAPLGSGGGSGHPWKVGSGGGGGNGGGSIQIWAKSVINYGTIEANGAEGASGGYYSGGGGGGSGGSIAIVGNNFANYGYVYAKGGRGGSRARDSGFDPDPNAKGGDGGMGRIHFDFLTTQSHGIVVPYPTNVTTYSGNIYIYHRLQDGTSLWAFNTTLPRTTSMMFIGHSVALYGNMLAVGSDEGTPVQPVQRVFLVNMSQIFDNTSTITPRVLSPPNSIDEKYGWKLSLDNASLVVAAYGSSITRGVVYVYQSDDLFHVTKRLTSLTTIKPLAGDFFGNVIEYKYPQLFVQLPLTQDDDPPASSRRSVGNIHHYKFVRNVSVAHSYVDCDFAVVTVNVTLNCTLHMISSDGFNTGDLNELPYFSPVVDFQSRGIYTFQRTFDTVGDYSVGVSYKQLPVRPFDVRVTLPIDSLQTNMTCSPVPALSGELVTCTIRTNRGAGEAIAAKDFDIRVYWAGAAQIVPNGTVVDAGFSFFQDVPSYYLVQRALSSEYPLEFPEVSFVKPGFYQFSFRPWIPGYFGVLGSYKLVAFRFPNPVIFEAKPNAVAQSLSQLQCPANVAPGRAYTCTAKFLSAQSFFTGDATMADYYRNTTLINATVTYSDDASIPNGTVYYPLAVWWSGEGRLSMAWNLSVTSKAQLHYSMSYAGLSIPIETDTQVYFAYPRVCGTYPELELHINLFEASMYNDIDTLRWGSWVESRAFKGRDTSWCDEARI